MADTSLVSFVHPEDEKLLESIIQKILSDTSNIFVLAEDSFRLDAFFLKFYQELSADEGIKVHRMMSPNVEETVELVNGMAASMSISEASRERLGVKHTLLISDQGPGTSEEWAACESLVSTFPGANINLVAFTSNSGEKASTFKNLGMKSRNTLIKLPELDLDMVLDLVANAGRNGDLSGEINTLLNSRWRDAVRKALAEDTKGGLTNINPAKHNTLITSSNQKEGTEKSKSDSDRAKTSFLGSSITSSSLLPTVLIVFLSVILCLVYYFEIVYSDLEQFWFQVYNLGARVINGWLSLFK